MSWILENAAMILEIARPLWTEYRFSGGYDSTKYPEDVYQALLRPSQIDNPWIRKSLIWKYGKWPSHNQGSTIPGTQEAAIRKFTNSLELLSSLKVRDDPSLCQQVLGHLPIISSIFLSHLLFPNFWAIVDQHTVRFLHWLRLQLEDYRVQTFSPWDLSRELNDLESLLANEFNTTIREIDKFMMTLGKRLKRTVDVSVFKNRERSLVNKMHLKGIDWVIYFPATGNQGRPILNYGVAYRDRVAKKTQPGRRINLRDVLAQAPIRDGYPHWIGLFLDASGRGVNWAPAYIECRIVRSEAEFVDWITEIEED